MIAIVDYGMGNLRSVEKALAAAGGQAHVTSDADAVSRADKIVVPGQGAFGGLFMSRSRYENVQSDGIHFVTLHSRRGAD